MISRKIADDPTFKAMWRDHYSVGEIALYFGVGKQTVSNAASVAKFPKRTRADVHASFVRRAAAAARCQDSKPLGPVTRDAKIRARLLETGGRYAELAALAAEYDWPMVGLMARWHRARAGQPLHGAGS